MKAATAIILAAGHGTRMNSVKPTALHEVAGRPVIDWMLTALERCTEERPVIVDGPERQIAAHVGERARVVVQQRPEGEADALRTALAEVSATGKELILALHGNLPLIDREYLDAIMQVAERDGAAYFIHAGEEAENAFYACGIFCAQAALLRKSIAHGAAQDALETCFAGMGAHTLMICGLHCPGVTDRKTLALCETLANTAIIERHFANGVTMLNPESVHIGAEVEIGRDTVLWPNVVLTGRTVIGEGCVIKPGCQLNDTRVGDGCTLTCVVADGAVVGSNVKAGPFVNLRPDTRIADGCKIGDFVEVKNSNVGEGTKLPHLSYIGDADVGSGVNVGCGCVFVNYDGYAKHRTTVGNDVFLGCQTNLIAPVTVGDGAYTAAGSTITHDVPAGAMAFARARQSNKEGYVEKFRSLKKK